MLKNEKMSVAEAVGFSSATLISIVFNNIVLLHNEFEEVEKKEARDTFLQIFEEMYEKANVTAIIQQTKKRVEAEGDEEDQ